MINNYIIITINEHLNHTAISDIQPPVQGGQKT